MNRNILVIYEKGLLRPASPLDLPEQTELEIRIINRHENEKSEAEQAYQVLLQAGLIRPSELGTESRVSENDRQKAAQAYGVIEPLSELIIAERDDK